MTEGLRSQNDPWVKLRMSEAYGDRRRIDHQKFRLALATLGSALLSSLKVQFGGEIDDFDTYDIFASR